MRRPPRPAWPRPGGTRRRASGPRRGIEAAPADGQLYWSLAELLLDDNRVDEVTRLSADLRKRGFPATLLDYLQARVLFGQEKWLKAAAELARVEPALERSADT